ncbi:TetR family transcriptional regulator C-terminal domain-containing protein [Streptomyces boncukensis]|uniref:TetR family transcriptional regulator n=1 Tax=Streptomyces boncukensis TaxID=2711219 RepID=A0A6G4WYK0_9ACTN|nr:TetR family transcriptional regulator [Streptomyces boncukensis]
MKTTPQQDTDAALGTRERIVRTTSRLMQRQGYDGTGIKQISREAGATLGSVYHFFPGGKQELAVAAIRHGDGEFADMLREVLAGEHTPEAAVAACVRSLVEGLRASDWADGCPVTATALGTAGRVPDIQQAAAEAFARWRGLVFDKLKAAGIAEDDARELASTVISTLEGAELAAQVARSAEPLEAAGRHLARLIGSYRPA